MNNTIFAYEAKHQARLDQLFSELKQASTADEADKVASQINILWRNAKGHTASLLLSRIDKVLEEENYTTALDLLDQLVALEPDFAEAWNRRAMVYFLLKKYSYSLSDIERVLALEPRHYGALRGLGLILEDMGEETRAYDMLKRSLEIYPFQENVRRELEALEARARGRLI